MPKPHLRRVLCYHSAFLVGSNTSSVTAKCIKTPKQKEKAHCFEGHNCPVKKDFSAKSHL
jgi:hypothetical protein